MASSTLIDIQRKFKKDLDKGAAIEEKRMIEESFLFVSPPKMDYRTLTVVQKANVKRGIMRLLKANVSKSEISRNTHIHRWTLVRWEKAYKKHGDHFFRKDDRLRGEE